MAESALGHLLLSIFIFSLSVLVLAVTPAMLTGWICAWRITDIGWRAGSLAGLGGGIFGVVLVIAWRFLAIAFREYEGPSVLLLGYVLVPILSAAAAWALCGLWRRRAAS